MYVTSLRSIAAAAVLQLALALAPIAAAQPAPAGPPAAVGDHHSFANPLELRVRHLDLDVRVEFEARRLSGVADLTVERRDPAARTLRLDTRDLNVRGAWLLRDPGAPEPLRFQLGAARPFLGRELAVELPAELPEGSLTVRISYQTHPQASGLQWLAPVQTADAAAPFVFTQSQAAHARSWVPLQDTPQVRMTYGATVRVPPGLRALMSAENDPQGAPDGIFRFEMPQPIPSYLLALAVGRLEFRPIGPRTGVYAEPSVVEAAAREFEDTEKMLLACERLFGPYRWGRYDLLLLPPSFPMGGMENPRLSFITPTVIAGDKSLVGLIAHELAHSWSGNLVTNATWRDLWLNEGFTVYLENRIVEAVYGERRAAMERVLGVQALRADLEELPPRDEVLAIDLRGRDPERVFSQVPYEKGALFLRWLESRVGRAALDAFLQAYFEHFAFQSITTEQFRDFLHSELLAEHPQRISAREVDAWLYAPGLPASAVLPRSDAFERVDRAREGWLAGQLPAAQLPTAGWTTHEWLHFLDNLPAKLSRAKLEELDREFRLTQVQNAEIAHSWLRIAVRNRYEPAYERLADYLTHIGRKKLVEPLYEELVKTSEGAARARQIYAQARPGYHPITASAIEAVLDGQGGSP